MVPIKIPAPPPNLHELLAEAGRKDARSLFRLLDTRQDSSSEPYLPWDKIRYKTPPPGLTHEEWWLGIRMARDAMLRKLPLKALDGSEFSYALPDEVLRLLDEVTQRASGQIATPEQIANPATRDGYVISSLIEEAITSSQLEGASTSRRDAKRMITYGSVPRNRSEQMILNNYYAMRHVSENRNADFTPDTICELHEIVTKGTLDNPESAGRVQNNPDPADRVKIFDEEERVLHVPPPVSELPGRLRALCDFANGHSDSGPYVPPVVRALAIHFMAGHDHYFEDGNGRTARALFYWSMLKNGYWLTEHLTISKILKKAPGQYTRAFILTEQDGGDLTHFLIYQLGVIKRALDELDEYLAKRVRDLHEARSLMAKFPGEFNHRQLDLLESAAKNPGNVFTVRSHVRSHGVSHQTARNDLQDLELRQILLRRKSGREFVWLPAPNMLELLDSRGE